MRCEKIETFLKQAALEYMIWINSCDTQDPLNHYLCSYLDGIVNTAKMSITSVISALGNDEPLDPFCKYLMFTHMYTPEQVKEIGHEEIYRREQKFEKELGLV